MQRIVGFGASSMQGVGDSAGGSFARVARHFTDTELVFDNHGIGGNCLADMLPRVAAAMTPPPDALIVLLGCNDLPRQPDGSPEKRTTLPVYTKRVGELLGKLDAPKKLFVTSFAVAPKVGIDPALFEAHMDAALAAARLHGYETWDLFRETRAEAAPFWADDGVHFNDDGHAYIAAHVISWIEANFAPQSNLPEELRGLSPEEMEKRWSESCDTCCGDKD